MKATKSCLIERNSSESMHLRSSERVSWRSYQCFSIALEVILFLSDRHKVFTSDGL